MITITAMITTTTTRMITNTNTITHMARSGAARGETNKIFIRSVLSVLFSGIVEYNRIVFHNRRKTLETEVLRSVLSNRLRPSEGAGACARTNSASHGGNPADGKTRRQAFRLP